MNSKAVEIEEIAKAAAYNKAWGWNRKPKGRFDELDLNDRPKICYLYQIEPSKDILTKLVRIKYDGVYGSFRRLLGLRVLADDLLVWDIVDSLSIPLF